MGAGVLLIDWTSTPTKSGLSVVLFREKWNGLYTDAGGANDAGESNESCASRELFEESAGLLDIDVGRLNKIKISLSSGYVAYVVPVREIERCHVESYLKNVETLRDSDVSSCFLETNGIAKFLLDDMIQAGFMDCNSRIASTLELETLELKTLEAKGETRETRETRARISKRTACVIQKAYSQGVFNRIYYDFYAKCHSLKSFVYKPMRQPLPPSNSPPLPPSQPQPPHLPQLSTFTLDVKKNKYKLYKFQEIKREKRETRENKILESELKCF